MQTLATWIRSHGYTVRVHESHVEIEIPWVNVRTGEVGADLVNVSTMADARIALGY